MVDITQENINKLFKDAGDKIKEQSIKPSVIIDGIYFEDTTEAVEYLKKKYDKP
jgi:hypothetical protein